MRIVMFYHSLISDWNHGNAHFLRGVASELLSRGHQVSVFEPWDGWSMQNLLREHGMIPIDEFHSFFPRLTSMRYCLDSLDLDRMLEGADLVLAHEWNDPELIRALGEHRARSRSYRLLFHDTHHRMVTQPWEMSRYDLRDYDGVLAFGRVIANLYLSRGLAARVWVWHEAADTRVFLPHESSDPKPWDLVWIGNWGDDERNEELQDFLIAPVIELGLKTRVHGVRYPEYALGRLQEAGIQYQGWIANFRVPQVFAQARLTVHIPRRPYVQKLPGIPTIRVFEALACRIPLLSAPWEDTEQLFMPGQDFLIARNGQEMREQMRRVLTDRYFAAELAEHGWRTVLAHHTCSHRVDQLLGILEELRVEIRNGKECR